MTSDYNNYFENCVYAHIKDFDFVKNLEEYEHTRKGLSLNFETKNIHELSSYKNLTTLHCFRLEEEQIKNFPNLDSVKNLSLSRSSIKDLSFLSSFPNLIYLNIDSCSNLESTNGLSVLNQIKILHFKGNMKLSNYKELAILKNIVFLRITGTVSGSILKMGSLDWITNLKNLERLELNNISTPKSDLHPISKLNNLKKLEIPEKSKVEEIAYLSASLPKTECFYFSPFYTELNKYQNLLICSKCSSSKIRLVGRGKNRVICKKCDIDLFNQHMELFKKWEKKGSEENQKLSHI